MTGLAGWLGWGARWFCCRRNVSSPEPAPAQAGVKRGKHDAVDAAAICEAMSRPGMRFVPIKSAESQAKLTLLGVCDLLIKQRTMQVNAMRGHAAEFGVIAAKGRVKVAELVQRATAEDACVLALAREMLRVLSGQIGR